LRFTSENRQIYQPAAPLQPGNSEGGARFWRRFWHRDSLPVSSSSKPPFARHSDCLVKKQQQRNYEQPAVAAAIAVKAALVVVAAAAAAAAAVMTLDRRMGRVVATSATHLMM